MGVFSGIFFLSLSPKHLKFWVESYLNKPNSKLHFQFKEIKLSLSQWGVFPIIGLKSSMVDIKVKPFKNACFDINTLHLNTIFIKINPIDLLFGKLHFSSIEVDNVNLDFNSFCENLSIESFSSKMSYFMHHKAESEINNFIKWIDKIEVNNFLLSNQVKKLMLIKNLKLVSYKDPKFLLLYGDTFPYLQNSFKSIEPIKLKTFIYPHTIKARGWWHLHEGVVKLNTQFLFSFTKQKKPKYQSQLKLRGNISYLPVSSALALLQKTNVIDIKFPELNTWLSCGFNAQVNFSKSLSTFSNSGFRVEDCKLQGLEIVANLDNSSWKTQPFRSKKNTSLYFSNLHMGKFINPFLVKWTKNSNYFTQFNPAFGSGNLLGRVSVLKNGIWNLDVNIKNSVLKFKKDKKLEWFSVSEVDLNIKTTADLSNIFIKLNNIPVPNTSNSGNKKTKMFFKYSKVVSKVVSKTNDKDSYALSQIKFNKEDLASLKGFPFLGYLEEKSKELSQ